MAIRLKYPDSECLLGVGITAPDCGSRDNLFVNE